MSSNKDETKNYKQKFPQEQEGQWMQDKNTGAQSTQLGGEISG